MTDSPETKKSLGQHWLFDDASLSAMCDAARLAPGDTVLEIGPGTGALTDKLLAAQARVVAVELDGDRIPELRQKYAQADFELYQESILKFDLTQLPLGYKVVANIPYYLTSNLIRLLSETSNSPSTAILLVQKEVAERVAAKPGDMSLLSVTAQYYWEVSLGAEVPARLFTPPPKVDSQILIMRRRSQPLFTGVGAKDYFWVVKAGFSSRRKTLLNSLSGGARLEKSDAVSMIDAAGLVPTSRPQELSLEQWHALADVYYSRVQDADKHLPR